MAPSPHPALLYTLHAWPHTCMPPCVSARAGVVPRSHQHQPAPRALPAPGLGTQPNAGGGARAPACLAGGLGRRGQHLEQPTGAAAGTRGAQPQPGAGCRRRRGGVRVGHVTSARPRFAAQR
eukprot:76282-Chlamydomonas_euryale.AAC.1